VVVREHRSDGKFGREADLSSIVIVEAEAIDPVANAGWQNRQRVLSIFLFICDDQLFEDFGLVDGNIMGSCDCQEINRSVKCWTVSFLLDRLQARFACRKHRSLLAYLALQGACTWRVESANTWCLRGFTWTLNGGLSHNEGLTVIAGARRADGGSERPNSTHQRHCYTGIRDIMGRLERRSYSWEKQGEALCVGIQGVRGEDEVARPAGKFVLTVFHNGKVSRTALLQRQEAR
jgi:hypothetical protein